MSYGLTRDGRQRDPSEYNRGAKMGLTGFQMI